MKQTDRAYVAGMIDRSCFMGIIKYDGAKNRYTVRIVMSSKEAHAFDKIAGFFKGSGCYFMKSKAGETLWVLQGRKRVADFLRSVLPYLGFRKRAAEKIIQFDNEWRNIPRGADGSLNDIEREAILARRDQLVIESLGLKPTWKREAPRAKKPQVYDWESVEIDR